MLSRRTLLKSYRTMLLIRTFEQRVEALFSRGAVLGTTHPAVGQEAIAVGAAIARRKGDFVTSTHRGHGHLLALGGDPKRLMAELFGKRTGYSRGRGGSQLMADRRIGFLGGNGITGGSIPVATGAALSASMRGTGGVAVCFLGDGASNQGTFHESLNMAAIWHLPAVYICENNQYAMSTHVRDAVSVPRIAARAAAYGIPGISLDGNDLFAVHRHVADACDRARRGAGPSLLECETYRLSGHSRGDPRTYRDEAEEDAWRKRDPIARLRKYLRQQGIFDGEADRAARAAVRRIVSASVTFARRSPEPTPGSLERGLYA